MDKKFGKNGLTFLTDAHVKIKENNASLSILQIFLRVQRNSYTYP